MGATDQRSLRVHAACVVNEKSTVVGHLGVIGLAPYTLAQLRVCLGKLFESLADRCCLDFKDAKALVATLGTARATLNRRRITYRRGLEVLIDAGSEGFEVRVYVVHWCLNIQRDDLQADRLEVAELGGSGRRVGLEAPGKRGFAVTLVERIEGHAIDGIDDAITKGARCCRALIDGCVHDFPGFLFNREVDDNLARHVGVGDQGRVVALLDGGVAGFD